MIPNLFSDLDDRISALEARIATLEKAAPAWRFGFEGVLPSLKQGLRVKRLKWPDGEWLYCIGETKRRIVEHSHTSNLECTWQPSSDDLLAEDWFPLDVLNYSSDKCDCRDCT